MRNDVMEMVCLNRRIFLKGLAAAGVSFSTHLSASSNAPNFHAEVPTRAITQGPKSHWFTYYDKLQFGPGDRYVLGMEVDFDFRAPQPEDKIRIGMVDLENDAKWIDLGETNAWCWQQGCMLQWIPGSDNEIVYNDRREGQFVSIFKNIETGSERVIPKPVYSVSPDGKLAVCPNFARLNDTRPGYGYCGIPDPFAKVNHPKDDGIYSIDLITGKSSLIISLDQITGILPDDTMKEAKHWFNHLLFNPSGERFIFLHRWRGNGKAWWTRMFTASPDGSEIYCLANHDMVSHFIWKDPQHILAWSREPEDGDHFHLYRDQTEEIETIGKDILKVDGHCTYSPDKKWVLTDTYPDEKDMHHLMLFRPSGSKLVKLGMFFQPKEVKGDTMRCDLHPRWSRGGKYVCIDSLCSGQRQMYLLDVSGVTGT